MQHLAEAVPTQCKRRLCLLPVLLRGKPHLLDWHSCCLLWSTEVHMCLSPLAAPLYGHIVCVTISERGRLIDFHSFYLLLKCLKWLRLGWACGEELYPGFLRGWQGPDLRTTAPRVHINSKQDLGTELELEPWHSRCSKR